MTLQDTSMEGLDGLRTPPLSRRGIVMTGLIAGYTLRLHASRKETLTHVVGDLFPAGGDVSRASFWCGLRPMTPDGTPIVGPTPIGVNVLTIRLDCEH